METIINQHELSVLGVFEVVRHSGSGNLGIIDAVQGEPGHSDEKPDREYCQLPGLVGGPVVKESNS